MLHIPNSRTEILFATSVPEKTWTQEGSNHSSSCYCCHFSAIQQSTKDNVDYTTESFERWLVSPLGSCCSTPNTNKVHMKSRNLPLFNSIHWWFVKNGTTVWKMGQLLSSMQLLYWTRRNSKDFLHVPSCKHINLRYFSKHLARLDDCASV